MTAAAQMEEIKNEFRHFADVAAPYSHITDRLHYDQALELIENLLEEVQDSRTNPLNAVISLLSEAVAEYESLDRDLLAFEICLADQPPDLALLRVLMDQYGLGTADLPEIGSKSMVSRVLSGQRSLSKKHIQSLSQRFGIDPGLFF